MARIPYDDLEATWVREALAYDAFTGIFIWQMRPVTHFKTLRDCNKFNARFAGKIAGNLTLFGHRQITLKYKFYLAHRLAWLYHYGVWPQTSELDHINGLPDDNRIENLREATTAQNQWNTGLSKANTSGFKGVTWDKHCNKWKASICINNESKHLGLFFTAEEAGAAYITAAKNLHFDFYKDTTREK